MSHCRQIDINLGEPFDHLPRAPIVEAVVHWESRPEQRLDREALLVHLKSQLPDYPHPRPQHEVRFEGQFGRDGSSLRQEDNWYGFRFESEDGRYIARFTRNGLVFSRLAPYENWERFSREARRLWRVYADFTKPSDPLPEGPARTIVYYFHGTIRCLTCLDIEWYARNAVFETYFAEMAEGAMERRSVNYEAPENRNYQIDFSLSYPPLVIVRERSGYTIRWKVLEKTWDLARDREAFTEYILTETQAFIAESLDQESNRTD